MATWSNVKVRSIGASRNAGLGAVGEGERVYGWCEEVTRLLSKELTARKRRRERRVCWRRRRVLLRGEEGVGMERLLGMVLAGDVRGWVG